MTIGLNIFNDKNNLTETPKPIPGLIPQEQQTGDLNLTHLNLTLGDLHGNIQLLLNQLIRANIIKQNNQEYNDFCKVQEEMGKAIGRVTTSKGNEYKESPSFNTEVKIKSDKIQQITKAFNNCKEQLNKIANSISDTNQFKLLRLIGDELADRDPRNNDYFTLLFLQQLTIAHENKKKGAPELEILCSNHSLEFLISHFEKEEEGADKYQPTNMIFTYQVRTLVNLRILLKLGLVKETEVVQLVNDVYKPKLKLISYDFNTEEKHLTIYSHAPALLNNSRLTR